VTIASLLVGLLGGHCFLYDRPVLNAIGLALLVGSDILDSADGQLARLRGTATRLGAALDGISDNLRFLNLYISLAIRVVVAGRMTPAGVILLAMVTGLSHSFQASVADFLRKVYLSLTTGSDAVDLPEDFEHPDARHRFPRLVSGLYRSYIARLPRMCPRSTRVVRELRQGRVPHRLGLAWQGKQTGWIRWTALFGQNVRFLLLGLTALPGWPAGMFWLTVGPLTLAAIIVLVAHERNAALLGHQIDEGVTFAAAGLG